MSFRFFDLLAGALVLAVLLGLAALLTRQAESENTGLAIVVDGDSLVLNTVRIRLLGIDAPELTQTCRRDGTDWACGRASATALRTLLARQLVTCIGGRHDQYGRVLATCRLRGMDLNARMVRDGLAVSYGAYAPEEAEARAAYRGLWAGTFDKPEAWRRAHPRPADNPF